MTDVLFYIHQKEKIPPKIAGKITRVNGPLQSLHLRMLMLFCVVCGSICTIHTPGTDFMEGEWCYIHWIVVFSNFLNMSQ